MEVIIIAAVVIVAIAAHVLLFHWVKFKIDEGVILQFLRTTTDDNSTGRQPTHTIITSTQLPPARVAFICRKSREIKADPGSDNSWYATRK
ncbi:MAG: hypothetical protein V7720_13425 [Halioglobus sp.]